MSKNEVVLVPVDGGLAMTHQGTDAMYVVPPLVLKDPLKFKEAAHKFQSGDLSFMDDWKALNAAS